MELDIQMNAYTFYPEGCSFDFKDGYGRTSTINIKQVIYTEISRNCYDIEIKTMNSSYNFQYRKHSEEKPLTKEERLPYQMTMVF